MILRQLAALLLTAACEIVVLMQFARCYKLGEYNDKLTVETIK